MQQWARWSLRSGSGKLGYARAILQCKADAQRVGYARSVVPVADVGAAEVNACVERLIPELVRTVREFYAGTGSVQDKAARLGCAVATVYSRVGQAHRELAQLIGDRAGSKHSGIG